MGEDEIRETILEALKQKFPFLKAHEFEFLKRDRTKLMKPLVSNDF